MSGFSGKGLTKLLLTAIFGLFALSMAAPTVKITFFYDRTIVQRDNGMGTYTAKGTYTGTPTGIEVRIVEAVGLKEARGWKTARLTPATLQWSAAIDDIPEGGWYRVQARYTGQTTIPAISSSRMGVGVILLMIGQSNGDNFNILHAPYKETLQMHPKVAFGGLGDFHWMGRSVKGGQGLPVVLLANNLATKLDLPVGILNACVGGSFIRGWLGDVRDPYYDLPKVLNDAITAAGGDVEMVLWHQGFSDFYQRADWPASTQTPEALKGTVSSQSWVEYEAMVTSGKAGMLPYYKNLERLYAKVDSAIKRPNVPFLCGIKGRSYAYGHIENKKVWPQIMSKPFPYKLAESRQVDCVRWSQLAFIKNKPNVFPLASTMDFRLYDAAHYRLRDRFLQASRITQSVLKVMGKASYGGGGPSFVAKDTYFDGKGIVLRVKHEGGNKLVIPSPAKPIEGFRVRKAATLEAVPIKKVSLRAHNSVFVEFNTPPVGDLFIEYQTGSSPVSDYRGVASGGGHAYPLDFDNDSAPGNLLYDNAVLPEGNFRTGLGLPVNPILGCIRVSITDTAPPPPDTTTPPDTTMPPDTISVDTIPADSSGILDDGQSFNGQTRLFISPFGQVGYSLPCKAYVSLRVYDAAGRLVNQSIHGEMPGGIHWEPMSSKGIAPGFYTISLRAGEKRLVKKRILR